jgi:hypothetical protein
MHIDYNDSLKSCYIWVPFSARDTYKDTQLYENTMRNNKAKGYSTCVYVGGNLPLITVMDDLLSRV